MCEREDTETRQGDKSCTKRMNGWASGREKGEYFIYYMKWAISYNMRARHSLRNCFFIITFGALPNTNQPQSADIIAVATKFIFRAPTSATITIFNDYYYYFGQWHYCYRRRRSAAAADNNNKNNDNNNRRAFSIAFVFIVELSAHIDVKAHSPMRERAERQCMAPRDTECHGVKRKIRHAP